MYYWQALHSFHKILSQTTLILKWNTFPIYREKTAVTTTLHFPPVQSYNFPVPYLRSSPLALCAKTWTGTGEGAKLLRGIRKPPAVSWKMQWAIGEQP